MLLGSIACGFAFWKGIIFAIGILYLAYLNPMESACFFAFIATFIFMRRAINDSQLVDNQTQI